MDRVKNHVEETVSPNMRKSKNIQPERWNLSLYVAFFLDTSKIPLF